MRVVLQNGNTLDVGGFKAVRGGIVLFENRDRDEPIGFIPSHQLQFVLPEQTAQNIAQQPMQGQQPTQPQQQPAQAQQQPMQTQQPAQAQQQPMQAQQPSYGGVQAQQSGLQQGGIRQPATQQQPQTTPTQQYSGVTQQSSTGQQLGQQYPTPTQ